MGRAEFAGLHTRVRRAADVVRMPVESRPLRPAGDVDGIFHA